MKTEEKIKELEKQIDDLRSNAIKAENELQNQRTQLRRELNKRDQLPVFFKFGYNDRRGDPQYTPYWYLNLFDPNGAVVWSQEWREDKKELTKDEVYPEACDSAWELVYIANAIFHHRREEDF